MERSDHGPTPPPDSPPRLDTLPPEIVDVVFSYLGPQDLASLARVSTSLLAPSYAALYRNVALHHIFPSFRALPGRLSTLALPPLRYTYSLHARQHSPSSCAPLMASLTPDFVLPVLSLPATSHPNIRDKCPLIRMRPRTLVIRAAPLLFVRVCYSFHSMRVERAIVAFTPDSAVVGTNFKFEVSPDGPNGFLRRFPNADVVVWVFAVRRGESWRPSPRPRNVEPRRGSIGQYLEDDERHGWEERAESLSEGQRRLIKEESEARRMEREYLAKTWVGRLLSPSVLRALKRRCPAVRELILVNTEALDPIAVVQDDLGPEHVGAVVRRWLQGQVGRMDGWVYAEGRHGSDREEMDRAERAEDGEGGVRVRCASMDAFVTEERERGPGEGGVCRSEVETWFEGECFRASELMTRLNTLPPAPSTPSYIPSCTSLCTRL